MLPVGQVYGVSALLDFLEEGACAWVRPVVGVAGFQWIDF